MFLFLDLRISVRKFKTDLRFPIDQNNNTYTIYHQSNDLIVTFNHGIIYDASNMGINPGM